MVSIVSFNASAKENTNKFAMNRVVPDGYFYKTSERGRGVSSYINKVVNFNFLTQNKDKNHHKKHSKHKNKPKNVQQTQVASNVQSDNLDVNNTGYNQQQVTQEKTETQQSAPPVVTSEAAEQIAMAESTNNYSAINGRYYGKYQLDISYLKGDLSEQNQEQTFQEYCNNRYGSVENALVFRQSHNWY